MSRLKEIMWGNWECLHVYPQRYTRPFCVTTTVLTSPDYIEVFNVFHKNIYLRVYFSFFVCRDLSQNAIRRLPPRIFTGLSQLRRLYVHLYFSLNKYDKKSLFPAVNIVLN